MSERTLKALVIVLAAVAATWATVALLMGRPDQGPDVPPALAEFFEGVGPESGAAVRFEGTADPVTLRREGDVWMVNGYAADSAAVATFWKAVGEAEVRELVANNPANHARMGVTADSASRLVVDADGEARTLLVGKVGPRFATVYVRLPDEDAVHLLEGDLRTPLTRSFDDWRNKRILAADTAAVARVAVERDGRRYEITRADSTWTLSSGEMVDPGRVTTILMELATLRATGFLEEGDSLAATPLAVAVAALDASGDSLAVLEIGGTGSEHWARARGNPVLYRLPSWTLDRVAPPREELMGATGQP
jgi:hypothetical protein